ncbi:MAG: HIT domain-containing protein [Nevskiales bacterium]
MAFELHPQLAQDCVPIGNFPLCRLLLMNDANYPWFILVPQREGLREIHELDENDLYLFSHESVTLARALTVAFKPDKLNIAALGNLLPQLHIHHIVRYQNDPAWPAPVWGKLPALPYPAERLNEVRLKILELLSETTFEPV